MRESVEVSWHASKLNLAGFFRSVCDGLNSNGVDLGQSGMIIEGFIYDLGHNGRGFDDFPRAITLELPDVSRPKTSERVEPEKQELEVEMSVSDLLEQFKALIFPYLQSHRYYKETPSSLDSIMRAIEAMKEHSSGWKGKVLLHPQYGGKYEVKSIMLIYPLS